MAYACGHFDRSHYSRGMCQNCYLSKYYVQRKDKKSKKPSGKEEALVDEDQKNEVESKVLEEVAEDKSEEQNQTQQTDNQEVKAAPTVEATSIEKTTTTNSEDKI